MQGGQYGMPVSKKIQFKLNFVKSEAFDFSEDTLIRFKGKYKRESIQKLKLSFKKTTKNIDCWIQNLQNSQNYQTDSNSTAAPSDTSQENIQIPS
ncbi:hypothetical protein TTHERM_00085120 (macronuclear) [Tetrahymena thermophila SB210]|uniref:Uncharacterized protein n=1 Tax=Tetrahymena thermophila (strain SB210) TaxID=312017 RepID=Q236T6_TETTS|nr:hypothetical protein TTHERM_00085120 [Tetrahymena thermophila SB210]EAR92414.1 hypothetical protein TTHERM_00085120 [Tetrahymena thermophila SB210]|eukprot:XP_001012659.1 hypothetical protein TTHERM_00085120 [Tetrahymena thermophila SB210]